MGERHRRFALDADIEAAIDTVRILMLILLIQDV
jgi:hypothetical protein